MIRNLVENCPRTFRVKVPSEICTDEKISKIEFGEPGDPNYLYWEITEIVRFGTGV